MTSAPEVRTPRDLAELRTWLLDQWQYDKPFACYTRARGSSTCGMFESTSDVWERRTLAAADLYWVSEDMVDLLLATASSVPDDVKIKDLTPPSSQGLVVFAKPWFGTDSVDGTRPKIEVDAMLWGGSHLGSIPSDPKRADKRGFIAVSTSMYRHLDFGVPMHPNDIKLAHVAGASQGGHFSTKARLDVEVTVEGHVDPTLDPVHDTQPLHFVPGDGADRNDLIMTSEDEPTRYIYATRDPSSNTGLAAYRVEGHTWVPLGRSDWPLVDQITEAPWAMDDSMRLSFVEDRKVLAALWTLLQQEGITRQEIHHVERHAQKRATRAGVEPRAAQKVQVVTLRKLHRNETAGDHEPTGRHIGVRYIRTGHFRWQPFGKGRMERRLTFIAPHVCGPEDAPLHVPIRVNAWRR